MAEKIKFLYGSTADINDPSSSSYPAVVRGQVYFAVDQLTSSAANGQIYFDVPVGTATDARRVLMSNRVAFATNASTASFASTANRATNDGSGQNISANYLSTAVTINNNTITFKNGDGTTATTISVTDTNDKVAVTSTSGLSTSTKLYFMGSTSSTLGTNNKTVTDVTRSLTDFYFDGATNTLHTTATAALTATSATNATNDGSGHNISANYLSTSVTISNNSITFKNGDGTTATTIQVSDVDEKLKVTSTASVGSKIWLVGNAASGLATAGNNTTSTGIVHKDIYIDTSGRINATTTTALYASTANRASNDSNGKSIVDFYLSTSTSTGTDYITIKTGSGNNGPKIPNLTMGSDGIIDIKHIPKNAIEKVFTASNTTAMYALTSTDVQNGDVVHVTDTNKMYFVVDDTALSSSAGYQEFAAGTAASVAWGNITGRPDSTLLSKNSSTISLSTGTSNAIIDVNLKTYDGSNGVLSTLTIPGAATNVAGLITTGEQTFAGKKTFNSTVNMTTAVISKRLNYSGIGTASGNNNYYIWMSSTGTKGVPLYASALTYNSSTKILEAIAKQAAYDDSDTTTKISNKYVVYQSSGVYLNTTTNVMTLKNGDGDTSSVQIQNYYPSTISFSTATAASTLTISNRSQHSSAVVSSITATLPVASTAIAGIVTASTQTFAGLKTFKDGITLDSSAQLKVEKDTTSAHSQDNNAAVVIEGGVTVKKQLSAKTVRVDNSSSTAGCTLTFDATQQVLSFVFQ